MSKGVTLPQSAGSYPALYPWKVSALGRALMFRVQAEAIRHEPAMAAFAAYYSLFHFTVFLMLQDTTRIDDPLCLKIAEAMRGGAADPSPSIRHSAVQRFAQENALPRSYQEALRIGQELREFLSYGPRVTWPATADRPHFNSCQYSAADVDALVGSVTARFRDGVRWLHETHATKLLSVVVFEVERYFDPDERFFSALSVNTTLTSARDLARELFPDDRSTDDIRTT